MIHLQDLALLAPPFVWDDDVIVVPGGGDYSAMSLVDLTLLAPPFGLHNAGPHAPGAPVRLG